MNAQTQTRPAAAAVAQAPASQGAVALRQPTSFEMALTEYEPQLAAALPDHIPLARFKRVIITAVNQTPELVQADRRSLFNSCVKAATDGLLPDGREGALVIFNTKVKKNGVEAWEKRVQWMPMIQGILKRARNTGELAAVDAHVVYENDRFSYGLGDEPHLRHEPHIGPDRGKPVGAYAIARLKDGMVQREFMTVAEIERVRAVSRAKDKGPWVDWWTEMARKTVARRMFKWLPTSSDLASLFDNDETLAGQPDVERVSLPPRPERAAFLDGPAAATEPEAEPEPEVQADAAEASAAETTAATFELWSVHGEMVGEFDDAGKYVAALRHEMSMAQNAAELEAVKDGNFDQLERVAAAERAAGRQPPSIADDYAQFAANFAAGADATKPKAAAKPAARAKPAEQLV